MRPTRRLTLPLLLTVSVVWAVSCEPRLPAETYYERGVDLHEQNDPKGALAALDRAIEVNARYAAAYRERGSVKYDGQDYPGAAADFDKAIEFDARDAESYFQRGLVRTVFEEQYFKRRMERERREELDRALLDLTKAIELKPDHANARSARAVCLLILGREDEADRDFDQARQLDPRLGALLDERVRQVREQRSGSK